MQIRNPFDLPGQWYKANLHTHTTTSDGDTPLVERVRQYRERGYSILAITDHNRTNDVSGLSTDGFLVLSGMETHPACDGSDPYHLVFVNVPHGFDCASEPDPNEQIRKAREAGGEVILGHPYWCGHNLNHLLRIEGAVAVEVYNATCTKIGKGISSVHWDDLLDAGRLLPAVAVDDVHRGRDIFMGWTMIRAEDLTVRSVMDALRTGCFYSSSGPTIERASMENGTLVVECSPAVEIHLIARRSSGRSFYSSTGETIAHIEFEVPSVWGYLRVEVVAADGTRAWTNPLVYRCSG